MPRTPNQHLPVFGCKNTYYEHPMPTLSPLCLGLLLLLDLAAGLDALQYALTILIELQLRDDDLGGVDANGDRLTRGLLLDETLDVDDVFETVDRGDLSFAVLVGASNNGNFVILSDWDGADLEMAMLDALHLRQMTDTHVVLLAKLLAERCAHDSTSNAGGSIEMSLATLSPRGVEGWKKRSVLCFDIVKVPLSLRFE